MSVTKDEVYMCDLIKVNNDQSMASFKELLKDCALSAGQIKRANELSAELQMKWIKKLKFQEPHEFKRKANEDQYKFSLKLAKTFKSAKSAAEKSNLEKVKSDLATSKNVRNCSWNGKEVFFLLKSLNTAGVRSKNTNNMI